MKRKKQMLAAILAVTMLIPGVINHAEETVSQTVVYVSQEGREGASGTEEDPFATIEEARDYMRTQKLDENNRGTVYIREGVYQVSAQNPVIELGEEDSYTTYAAYTGESVILTGTVTLAEEKFKKLSEVSGEQYSSQSRLQEDVREKIYVYDLGVEQISTGELVKNGFNWPKQPFQPELLADDEIQTLAKYPNDTVLTQKEILAGKTKNGKNEDETAKAAGANEGERPRNYWFDKTDNPKTYEEMLQLKGPVFYTRNGLEKRIGTWAPPTVENEPQNNQPDVHVNTDHTRYETDGWLSGYFENNYANDMCRIYSVDTKKQTIHCKYPSLQGVQDKRIQLTAINLLCELDMEGEYYIDRYDNHDVLYYYPKNGTVSGKTITLTCSNTPFFHIEGARELKVKGINMTGATGYGMILRDCESCVIESCEFSNISLDAVRIGENNDAVTADPSYEISHGGHNNVVRNCLIHDMGGGGVYAAGGNEQTLEAGGHMVEHCEFYNISRLQTYTPAVYLEGVGNTAQYNYIHDAPHMVIQIMGNDMKVSHNHIKNVCTNTSDQAPIYSGRCFNWLGNEVSYNFIEKVPSGCYGVYMDDGMSGMIIKNNVFKDIKGTAIFSNNGFGHQISDNIFIDANGIITYKCFGGSRPIANEKVLKYRFYRIFREGNGSDYTNTKENINIWYEHYKTLYPYLSDVVFPEETDESWNENKNSVFVPNGQVLKNLVVAGKAGAIDTDAVKDWQDEDFLSGYCRISSASTLGWDEQSGKLDADSALAEKEGYGSDWINAWNAVFTLDKIGICEETGKEPSGSEQPSVTPNPSDRVPTKPQLTGDIDGNSKVELVDAQLALKAALKIIRLDEMQMQAADADKNGRIELADAQLILKCALKITDGF